MTEEDDVDHNVVLSDNNKNGGGLLNKLLDQRRSADLQAKALAISEELVPFFTYTDLYLRPIHKVGIHVTLPKLRQMGQSVSNWEIRVRFKLFVFVVKLCYKNCSFRNASRKCSA